MGILNTMASLPLAKQKKNKFNKSSVNCTTQDFFDFKPVFSREIVPNEDLKISLGCFSRLLPMVRPAYARARIINRCFQVPYRTIMPDWNDFLEETPVPNEGIIHSCHWLYINNLAYVFTQPGFHKKFSKVSHFFHGDTSIMDDQECYSKAYDFIVQNHDWSFYVETQAFFQKLLALQTEYDDTSEEEGRIIGKICNFYCPSLSDSDPYYLNELDNHRACPRIRIANKTFVKIEALDFSRRGAKFYDTIVNLGYNIDNVCYVHPDLNNMDIYLPVGSDLKELHLDMAYPVTDVFLNSMANSVGRRITAMPLLALLKIWCDWYKYQQFSAEIEGYDPEVFFRLQGSREIDMTDLMVIAQWLTSPQYDKDYFTCGELNPISRFDSDDIVIPDVTNPDSNNEVVSVQGDGTLQGTPYITDNPVTQFMINALQKLTNYMMRRKIAGGRTLDRMLAEYGVKLSSEKLKRSVYLGKSVQPVQIMDVTQTSATTDYEGVMQPLGDYGGKGVAQGNGTFTVKNNDEFCQVIILSMIVPEVSYYQGIKREMFHLGKYDFYSSEWDNLGYQAVRRDEVINAFHSQDYATRIWLSKESGYSNNVFSWLPRFAEYKNSTNQDVLSGNFRVPSLGQDSLRYFHLFRELDKDTFKGGHVVQSKDFALVNDVAQYDRIFQVTDADYDHFITFFSFDVLSYAPMSQMFDSYDFGDDEEHSRHVPMPYGGSRF